MFRSEEKVLDIIGRRDTEVANEERLGERAEAYQVWLKGNHPHAIAKAYDLAPETRKAALWVGLTAMTVIVGALALGVSGIRAIVADDLAGALWFFGGVPAAIVAYAVLKKILLRTRPLAAEKALSRS